MPPLVEIMACRLFSAKSLFQLIVAYCTCMLKPANKSQRNLGKNSLILIQESVFESVVYKMVTIFTRPQCVN